MNTFIQVTDRLSKWAAWVGGGLLFATAILIAVEVTLRKVFSVSLGGAEEISSYVLAISCSWSFGYALFRKAHIRIDVLYVLLPQKLRYALDILSLALFGFYMLLLSYFASWVVLISIKRHSVANTPMATPLWLPESLWLAGIFFFTLTVLVMLAGALYYLMTGNPQEASQLAGTATLQEEIEEESGPGDIPLETGGTK
jgi:TRAP-type C4-dicarboxylate transport system permease small subunit